VVESPVREAGERDRGVEEGQPEAVLAEAVNTATIRTARRQESRAAAAGAVEGAARCRG